MPIRINLLSEAIAAEDLRRRDPVKRAIFIGLLLVAGSLVWYSSTWLGSMMSKESLNHVEAEIETHTNDYAHVMDNTKNIAEVQRKIGALKQLNAERFLQGNLLNALQQTYVPNVMLIRMRVDQTYSQTLAQAPKTNNFGVVPGRPAMVTEHVIVNMDARDYSPNPGDQVNHYKDALQQQDYFKTVLNPANGVRLSALTPVQTEKEGKPFVTFSLECRFQDRP